MNLEFFVQEMRLAEHILAVLLGAPRLFMIVQTAPFLGGNVLTGSLRMAITLAFYSILHPAIVDSLPSLGINGLLSGALPFALIILKETLIGTLLGLLVGMLFWAVQSAGFLIDNQCGATQSSQTDILSGDQTSPLGTFFFQAIIIVFFITGGFLVLLQAIYNSYVYWPVTSFLPVNLLFNDDFALFFAGQVSNLMLLTVLFSGPVLIACFLTDFSLGLVNRFASQLNVYVLSMPIKSGIASFLVIFYLAVLLKYVQPMFQEIVNTLQNLKNLT